MVVTISSNVTATLVAAVQELDVLEAFDVLVAVPDCAVVVTVVAVPVVVVVPVAGVWLAGKLVTVAVVYDP
jgi:hypothetical protein